MRGFKTLLGTTALLAGLILAPAAKAQVAVEIGVPPVCPYGYYETPPYACAPVGFYGPGFFYNGIFLGVGPGPGGATLTAGANIASSMQAAAVITDAAAMKPIMVTGPTAITMMITTAIIMAIITKATGGMLRT